jgi:hypothetical protein
VIRKLSEAESLAGQRPADDHESRDIRIMRPWQPPGSLAESESARINSSTHCNLASRLKY